MEFRQSSYLDIGTGIVGSICREHPSVTMVGVQEYELGEDLCVPVTNIGACDIHLPMIRIIFISDGDDWEDEEIRELEGHDLPTGLGAVG